MKKIEGKVAVITGGARDIGRAVAIRLAEEGAKLCVNYCNNEKNAEETLNILKGMGAEAIMVKADVTKAAEVKHLIDETVKAFGDKTLRAELTGHNDKIMKIVENSIHNG
mgnify:CR=1 FL=1